MGLHHAGPVGVDHSIELPTGPQGIAVAGPVGVDQSIKNAAKLFSYKKKTKRTILTLTLSLNSPSISSSKKRPN
jgi:hypothetical protein